MLYIATATSTPTAPKSEDERGHVHVSRNPGPGHDSARPSHDPMGTAYCLSAFSRTRSSWITRRQAPSLPGSGLTLHIAFQFPPRGSLNCQSLEVSPSGSALTFFQLSS